MTETILEVEFHKGLDVRLIKKTTKYSNVTKRIFNKKVDKYVVEWKSSDNDQWSTNGQVFKTVSSAMKLIGKMNKTVNYVSFSKRTI